MRRFLRAGLVTIALLAAASAGAAIGRIHKVLPHYLDAQGHHSISPSLFDRDAYQARLRQNPELRSGMRFDINWRVRSVKQTNFRLKLELRGIAQGNLPRQKTLERQVTGGSSARWAQIRLAGEDYRELGEITAWRVTLWEGDELLAEQASFLW
jgi:hypothetical protein